MSKKTHKKRRGIERGKSVTFGQKIKRMRREKDMSQEKLALEAGIERAALSRIERDKTNIRLTTIEKLAMALETTASELLRD